MLELKELEELEKALLSNYPNENNILYFYTAATEQILDPKNLLSTHFITILTGKLNSHSIPLEASSELRNNLKMAEKINNYVKQQIPFSGNFLQRAQIFSEHCPHDVKHIKIVQAALDLVRENSSDLNPTKYAEKTLEYKTGNCMELSLVGLLKDNRTGIIRVKIINGDHYFLIIGYKPKNPYDKNIDLEDLIRNPDAVVCDPWTRSNYPTSRLKQYLFDYCHVDHVDFNGRFYTQVQAFDSSKQSLRIVDGIQR